MKRIHIDNGKSQYPVLLIIFFSILLVTLPLVIEIKIPVIIYILLAVFIGVTGYVIVGLEIVITALLFLSQGIVSKTNPYNYQQDLNRLINPGIRKSVSEAVMLKDGETFFLRSAVIRFDLAGHYIIKRKKASGIDHKYYVFPVVSDKEWTSGKPVFLLATCYNYFEQPLCHRIWKDALQYELKIYSTPKLDKLRYAWAIEDARNSLGLDISSEVKFVEPVKVKYRTWHWIYQLSLYLLLITGIIYIKKNKNNYFKKGFNNE